MGNSQSGSISEDKKKNYSPNQNGKKSNKKKAELQNDLWIPTPTSTSVFSELDKHSYAAEILDDNLNPIREEEEYAEGKDDSLAKIHSNGGIDSTGVHKSPNNTKITHPENAGTNSDRLVYHHNHMITKSETNITKSMEVLTFGEDKNMNGNAGGFNGVRYSAAVEGTTHYKSNTALNTIPYATLERAPPQRSASLRVVKLEAGPWQHQKPSYGELPRLNGGPEFGQRNKVTRRSSWTPSTSRFKKIFLLNKPQATSTSTSRPVWQRSLSDATGEKYYQRTADGHIVAMSPESTLRTSQWIAQHSNKVNA